MTAARRTERHKLEGVVPLEEPLHVRLLAYEGPRRRDGDLGQQARHQRTSDAAVGLLQRVHHTEPLEYRQQLLVVACGPGGPDEGELRVVEHALLGKDVLALHRDQRRHHVREPLRLLQRGEAR